MHTTPTSLLKTPPRRLTAGWGWNLRFIIGGLFALFAGIVEDGLADDWIIGRPDTAATILVEVGIGKGLPQNILIGGVHPTFNMESTSVAVTDRRIICCGAKRLVNRGNKPSLASGEGERSATLSPIGTGGGGLGLRCLASAEAAQGLCCGVFHNAKTIPKRLGIV
jgi:hypothetical protein